jgi:hypothetical protein
MAAAACSSTPPARTVASLPGHGGTTTAPSGVPNEAQSDQEMVNFTRCMRAHGTHMSDPFHRPGHSGLTIDLPPQDAATQSAYSACNHILGPIMNAKQSGAGGGPNAGHLPALTAYAECMRSHDISMLDPTPQGILNLGNVPGMTSDFGRYTPQFRSADSACRHLLPASVHDDGTGP